MSSRAATYRFSILLGVAAALRLADEGVENASVVHRRYDFPLLPHTDLDCGNSGPNYNQSAESYSPVRTYTPGS